MSLSDNSRGEGSLTAEDKPQLAKRCRASPDPDRYLGLRLRCRKIHTALAFDQWENITKIQPNWKKTNNKVDEERND